MKDPIKRIDLANIALLIISLVLAYSLPFKLFLFSYGILGPLHYLTEIHWLRSHNYFLKRDLKFGNSFYQLAIALSFISLLHTFISGSLNHSFFSGFSFQVLILFIFVFTLLLRWASKRSSLFWIGLMSYSIAIGIKVLMPRWLLVVGMLLPTIVHVFIFTSLFMFYGASKSRSRPGYIAFSLLLTSPMFIAWVPIDIINDSTGNIQDSLTQTGMNRLNHALSKVLVFFQQDNNLSQAKIYLKIQVFVAFAYTYHYLNWFSKTSIIGWRKSLNKNQMIWLISIWIISVALYWYDFATGFYALFFLSALHVILEFPLNILTIKNVLNNLSIVSASSRTNSQ